MSSAGKEGRLVNAEHEVQLHLVKEIRKALREQRDVGEIVSRLAAWSKAHFASEELLMRLHAYPEADVHADAHRRLAGALGGTIDASTIDVVAETIRGHIREHDARLHDFLDRIEPGARA